MNPSETAIREAVENLKRSPGTFQRLVERYAQLTFPDRFRELLPKGRNPQDVTIKGWPDAYVLLPDGRIDAVEMTHSHAWESHLSNDYEKAKKLGQNRLAGFLYVAWARDPGPDKKNEHRDRFAQLGVPADRIKFVFMQELVTTLTRPRFAEWWVNILGLRCECLPFQPIRQAQLLFGRDDQVTIFAPTMREYREGKVHRPQLADEIERHLNGRGWAFVRGLGAAGKTVLATQTALSPACCTGSAYYCDLVTLGADSTDAGASAALETITTRSDETDLYLKLALKSPADGIALAVRLDNLGSWSESSRVFSVMSESPEVLGKGLLSPGVRYIRSATQRMVRLCVCRETELDECLASDKSVLEQAALRTPLDHFASFLDYAEPKLPAVHEHLSMALAESWRVRRLAERMIDEPLHFIETFLRAFNDAGTIVQAIDLEAWEQARRSAKPEQPHFVGTIDREFRRLGRPELSAAPAETLICAAELVHWHNPVIGIVHLSHTLRLGRAVGEDAIQRFLDRVLTGKWLDDQYHKVLPGQLGAALLSIWSYHTDTVVSRFSTHALRKRLAKLMQRLRAMSLEDECHALQLWGTSRLLRLDVEFESVQWPSNHRCRELLELARPQQESLNRWMIDWLERCAEADWQILADETPLS